MKFSLVLCTLGRTEQLKRFVPSLSGQSYGLWNLVVVDQNPDDRLGPILNQYATGHEIHWIRSEKGLSRARNAGLKYADGDVIGFPDDDCWYGSDLLERIERWFQEHPKLDGVSVSSRDSHGRPSGCHWDSRAGLISRNNVWRRAISISIFLRREVIEKVGEFDVSLGLGSGTPQGSGEETDYLLRALECGFRLQYLPSLSVFHEQPVLDSDAAARGYCYGLGFGHVQRKHRYPFPIVFYYWLRSAAGVLVSVAKLEPAKARLYWGNLKGRVAGWLH